jgi:hypothetical protein
VDPQADLAVILDRTEDNDGYQIMRRRGADQPVEFGTIRPLREGKSIDGEVVTLKPRQDAPWLCEVNVELADPRKTQPEPAPHGPAQVATSQYRQGWDAIWGNAPGDRRKLN